MLLGIGGGHEQESMSTTASVTTAATGAAGGNGGSFCVCVCLFREEREPSEGLDLDGCEEETAQEEEHGVAAGGYG